MSNMLIGYFFDNGLLILTKDSPFLLLTAYGTICEDFWLPKNNRPKISALTVRPRNKKSEFSPLCSLLSGQNIQTWTFKKISKLKVFLTIVIIEVEFWKTAIAQLSKGSALGILDLPMLQVISSSHPGMLPLPAGSSKTAALKRGLVKTSWIPTSKIWKKGKM
jgi:hypothetical protein